MSVWIFGLLILLIPFSCFALETASVLPAHVSRFRMVGVVTSGVADEFNGDGLAQSYAQPFNRSFTAKDLSQLSPKLGQLYNAIHNMDASTANQLGGINLFVNSNIQVDETLFAYEYGITNKFSIGIRAPIVHMVGHVQMSTSSTNNGPNLERRCGNLCPQALAAGLKQFANTNLDQALVDQFAARGYDTPGNFETTAMGDTEVGGKYLFFDNPFMASSVQTGIRIPTGTRPSTTNFFDLGTGNGAWAYGIDEYNDFYVAPRWTVGTMFHWGYMFPDQFYRAVPLNASDILPSNLPQDGQVQPVDRTQGQEWSSELSTSYKFFHQSIMTWTAYQFYAKGADHYTGPGDFYYQGLEELYGPAELRHSLEFGLGYSSIPDYLSKRQKFPYEIQALYNDTIAGENVPVAGYVRVDLIAYF